MRVPKNREMSLLFGYSTNLETIEEDIDMDGNRILDLPSPTSNSEPVTKRYADTHYSGGGSGSQGPIGDKGDTGPQGPKGDTGLQGPGRKSQKGTPVPRVPRGTLVRRVPRETRETPGRGDLSGPRETRVHEAQRVIPGVVGCPAPVSRCKGPST